MAIAQSAVANIYHPAPLPTSYSTNFPANESSISEGGRWRRGKTNGVDWQDPATSGGLAFASTINLGTDDNIACLDPAKFAFAADHTVTATIHKLAGYTAPDSHEISLYLRQAINAHSVVGYECLIPFSGSGQIVRWNGVLNDFTPLTTGGPGIVGVSDGDTFVASIVGSSITLKQNGSTVLTATDSTWTTGTPGMGFFVRTGGTPSSYCISSWAAV